MSRFLPLLLVLLLALPVRAQVSEDLAASFVAAAGLGDDAAQIGSQMLQQIQSQAGQFPEPAREPFLTIYAEAMSEDVLRERVVDYVAAEGSEDDLEAALVWLEQPLVVRMMALEDSTGEDPNAQVAVQMYAMTGSFVDTPVAPEREVQMDRYLEVSGSAEDAVDLYLDIIVASAESMAPLRAEGEEPPQADTIRARMRPQLEGMLGGVVRGGTLYAFRDVSDEDFGRYIAELETPAGQYVSDLGTAALKAAVVGAISEAGSEFAQVLLDLDARGEIDLDAMREKGEGMEEGTMEMEDEPMMEDDGMEGEMEDDGQ